MIVLYVVLCFTIRAYQAIPLYLEIHHRDSQTGELLSTTQMEIENGVLNNKKEVQPLSLPQQEIPTMEYYYDCSMPLPPPIEKSNLMNYDKKVKPIPVSSTVIKRSITSYSVREPTDLVDMTIGGVNGLILQIMNFGFRAFNIFG